MTEGRQSKLFEEVYAAKNEYNKLLSKRVPDPKTGKIVRSYRSHDNFEEHNNRPPKKGYHLHHVNMHKLSDDISNLREVTPTRHQEFHTIYNTLCKGLMDDGIIGFNDNLGYYRIGDE